MRPGSHTYPYPRPALTVDLVVVRYALRRDYWEWQALLIERRKAPFARQPALPGGFVNEGEEPVLAAARELREETGVEVSPADLHLVEVFGKPGRDPRGWTVALAYLATVPPDTEPHAGDDAAVALWVPLSQVPWDRLAFDHEAILKAAFAANLLPRHGN